MVFTDNVRETFNVTTENASIIPATDHIVVENRINAERNNNLPHNALTIANQDSTSTVYIFFDNFSDQDKPTYILFPNQQITVSKDDGVSFTTLFLKNTHATHDIPAKAIKMRVSTLKLAQIKTEQDRRFA